jgi:hypothetical protein
VNFRRSIGRFIIDLLDDVSWSHIPQLRKQSSDRNLEIAADVMWLV